MLGLLSDKIYCLLLDERALVDPTSPFSFVEFSVAIRVEVNNGHFKVCKRNIPASEVEHELLNLDCGKKAVAVSVGELECEVRVFAESNRLSVELRGSVPCGPLGSVDGAVAVLVEVSHSQLEVSHGNVLAEVDEEGVDLLSGQLIVVV